MNTYLAASGSNPGQIIGGLFIWAALIIGYWVPSIVAWRRHVPNQGSVTVINFFLGWTVIGWVVALAMAMRDPLPRGRESASRADHL